jgi:hypothetical protein
MTANALKPVQAAPASRHMFVEGSRAAGRREVLATLTNFV